jgi:hypothetical protein
MRTIYCGSYYLEYFDIKGHIIKEKKNSKKTKKLNYDNGGMKFGTNNYQRNITVFLYILCLDPLLCYYQLCYFCWLIHIPEIFLLKSIIC